MKLLPKWKWGPTEPGRRVKRARTLVRRALRARKKGERRKLDRRARREATYDADVSTVR